MKYTKGPWRSENAVDAGCYRVYSDNEQIAETYLHGSDDEANAHLIAAAPKMYEVLNEVMTWAHHNLLIKNITHLEAIIEPILAKAEGK